MSLRRGRAGERAAEKELRRRGMKVLERNLRSAGGEIDLVALDGTTIVFVEVKARSAASRVSPAEAVDGKKRRVLVRAAVTFLKKKRLLDRPRRYDIAAVELDGEGRARSVTWLEAAFDEGEFG